MKIALKGAAGGLKAVFSIGLLCKTAAKQAQGIIGLDYIYQSCVYDKAGYFCILVTGSIVLKI